MVGSLNRCGRGKRRLESYFDSHGAAHPLVERNDAACDLYGIDRYGGAGGMALCACGLLIWESSTFRQSAAKRAKQTVRIGAGRSATPFGRLFRSQVPLGGITGAIMRFLRAALRSSKALPGIVGRNPNCGFNVTIPLHKQRIFDHWTTCRKRPHDGGNCAATAGGWRVSIPTSRASARCALLRRRRSSLKRCWCWAPAELRRRCSMRSRRESPCGRFKRSANGNFLTTTERGQLPE